MAKKPSMPPMTDDDREMHDELGFGKKVYIDKHPDIGEYKVHRGKGTSGYYTSDKSDAVDTAKAMHGQSVDIVHRSKRYE